MHVDLVAEPQYESLIDLLCELHAYYNEGTVVARDVVREHLLDNLLGPRSPHRLIVATADGSRVLGLAAITLVYSLVDFAPDMRRHCQLKELYVSTAQRSQGAGRALMAWVSRYARDNGCSRIDWPVKASNIRGMSFYEGLGAALVSERLSYRLSEPDLSALAYGAGAGASCDGAACTTTPSPTAAAAPGAATATR
jgi:ribosomal protein S18 acetylase RimI-like enzyme